MKAGALVRANSIDFPGGIALWEHDPIEEVPRDVAWLPAEETALLVETRQHGSVWAAQVLHRSGLAWTWLDFLEIA